MPLAITPPGIGTNPPPAPPPPTTKNVPGYGQQSDLGANWRIKFADADGIPLNMLSFEQIDFGAIAYKEIFQNVKTILATPIMSAALERLLGVDQNIVDLPIDRAAEATVAILDALHFWEPRVAVVNIGFESDVISGHLDCNLQLSIKNVIYGTDTPYDRNNIFDTPTRVPQTLPEPPGVSDGGGDVVQIPGPPGPSGPPGPGGATGARGSLWFTGTNDPAAGTAPGVQAQDMFLNSTTGAIFQFDGGSKSWKRIK
jgi:phage baseplate assembly protein W